MIESIGLLLDRLKRDYERPFEVSRVKNQDQGILDLVKNLTRIKSDHRFQESLFVFWLPTFKNEVGAAACFKIKNQLSS
jgi:hypothetical protein